MRTIIAGSRTITKQETANFGIQTAPFSEEITEVVSGRAKGVDILGENWAIKNNKPIKFFPVTSADWETHGKKAGMLRNQKMGDYADALIAIWDGESKGTKHMIDYARKKGLRVFVYVVTK